MSVFATAIARGLHAARPTDNATNTIGRLYYETDTLALFRDNGTSWDSYSNAGASGDVVGPASAVANNIALFDGVTGKLIKDSAKRFVNARYETNAGQSIGNNSATIVDFEDQTYDTTSAVTTGAAWKFTAPITGIYSVSARVMFATTATIGAGEIVLLQLYKNNSVYSNLHRDTSQSSTDRYVMALGVDCISLSATDYIDVRITQVSGGSLNLLNNAQYNNICINLVG
jgi:hypothetical protein